MSRLPSKIDLPYRGTPQTVVKMFQAANGPRGQKSFRVRCRVEEVIRHIRPKDYLSEIMAVYLWTCGTEFRYTRDPERVELVKDPERLLDELEGRGVALGDCDDLATFLIAALGSIGCTCRIVTVGFTKPGEALPDKRVLSEPGMHLVTSPHPRLSGPFTHVFAQVKRPGGSWVTVDPVAGPRTRRMHSRVKQLRVYVDRQRSGG